jgi:hypothetical protein
LNASPSFGDASPNFNDGSGFARQGPGSKRRLRHVSSPSSAYTTEHIHYLESVYSNPTPCATIFCVLRRTNSKSFSCEEMYVLFVPNGT